MTELRIEAFPDDLYERLRLLSERGNVEIDELITSLLVRGIANAEWWERWENQPGFEGEFDSVQLLREAREENEKKWDEYFAQRGQLYVEPPEG